MFMEKERLVTVDRFPWHGKNTITVSV